MVKYCPECGTEIKQRYKFCGKCGHSLPQEVPTKEESSAEKEIDKDLKKIEESISRKTVEKEPKNVEERLSAWSRDESLDVRKEKEKKEPKVSKKEGGTTAKKKPTYKETEKKVMTRTKKITIIAPFIIILSIALFLVVDADGDGLNNLAEIQHGTAMFNSDSDYDGLSDRAEIDTYDTDPLSDDSDNDGLDDNMEINTYHTNPLDADYDNDGLEDGDEVQLGTNLFDSDTDDDGYKDGLDPHPTEHEWKFIDSDNDGWSDYKEYYEEGTDRYDSDTDDDGYKDGLDPHPTEHEWKFIDSDNDGWSDYKEYYETGTSILSSDTDGDGALDPRDANPLNPSYDIIRNFEWDYPHEWWNKKTWTWSLSLSRDLYNYMKQLPRISYHEGWSEYTVDPIVTNLATGLKEAAEKEGFDSYQTVSFILAFVQSLPYTEDDVTTGSDDYPRYPIETLVDEGGDCEDTSFLFAGILKELNYGVCLINPPGHVAVGVLGSDTLYGTYYESDGERYYYCETTGSGYEIGDCPDEYMNESAQIVKL